MNNRILIHFVLIIFLLFSCKSETEKPKAEYNQKANELIQQLILEDKCECILEIPEETTMEFEKLENPRFNSEIYYSRRLSKKDINEMDSLSKIKQSFKLNSEFIKTKNIKIISRDSIRILYKDINFLTKTCKNGVTYFNKPNFNKNFNVATISYGTSGMCTGTGSKVFELKKNKWIKKEN